MAAREFAEGASLGNHRPRDMRAPPFDDSLIRAAAFVHVRRLQETHDSWTSEDLRAGFAFQGERLQLIKPQRGIFKPQRMQHQLSIRTLYPRSGARVWYDDQREVHRQIYEGNQDRGLRLLGREPGRADDRWLHEVFEAQVPLIYSLGTAPGRCQAIVTLFVAGWDRRCSSTRPIFVNDTDERLGQPVVPNGIPLSKIRHAESTEVRPMGDSDWARSIAVGDLDVSGVGHRTLVGTGHTTVARRLMARIRFVASEFVGRSRPAVDLRPAKASGRCAAYPVGRRSLG